MLHEFLLAERENILALCAHKLMLRSQPRTATENTELGLSIFYDELIEVLRADEEGERMEIDTVKDTLHRESAVRCGRESLRLGYTISQVVHGYGVLCQVITQYAADHGGEPIQAREFNRLNFCLDIVIAEAVTEFSDGQRDASAREEVQRLGFLAHELRNALGNAATAHFLIKSGVVGMGGSTNKLLETALTRMKDLIDRSLSEVRLRGETTVDRRRCRVVDLVGEVEATASFEADARLIRLHVDVSPNLIVEVDHHLVVSAISNLVQNAIKFTGRSGNVWIRGTAAGDRVLIEIEDECVGLPPGKIEELFQPFTQKGSDRRGIGLGLSISRRAIMLNDGEVSARDLPEKGCIFTISLPKFTPLPGEEDGDYVPIH